MKQIELGRTGQKVSELALGCMWMGTSTSEGASRRLLDRYLEAGGNFLDTANCYAWFSHAGATGTESESLLGRWLAASGKREQVFLASKVGGMVRDSASLWSANGELDWERARREYEGAGAETVRRGIDASLRRLQTDYLDLYYVHVDDWVTPLEETLEALAGLVRAGKVRYLGWSNVRTERLESIQRLCAKQGWPAPVAVQQQHTYLRPRAELEPVSIAGEVQLEYLRRHPELALVAYSPVLKGVYDDPAKRRGHWIMQSYEGPDSTARLAALERAAQQLGVRPNQLVLAWLLQQRPPRVIPLVGARTPEQLEQHLEACASSCLPSSRRDSTRRVRGRRSPGHERGRAGTYTQRTPVRTLASSCSPSAGLAARMRRSASMSRRRTLTRARSAAEALRRARPPRPKPRESSRRRASASSAKRSLRPRSLKLAA